MEENTYPRSYFESSKTPLILWIVLLAEYKPWFQHFIQQLYIRLQ